MEYSRADIEKRINNYYKFVIVRHPLERILSAYRHLFEEREDNKIVSVKHFGVFNTLTIMFRFHSAHSHQTLPYIF